MYEPKKYLTMQVASEVLAEFEWPERYVLEDWSPDGIAMIFPKCTLIFSEGFESDMDLVFSAEDTGLDETLTLTDALLAIRSTSDPASLPPAPALIRDHIPHASLEKVKIGIRNLSMLILTYLPSCMLGDFSWVGAYRAFKSGAGAPA